MSMGLVYDMFEGVTDQMGRDVSVNIRFSEARKIACEILPSCHDITAGEFFRYCRRRGVSSDTGDFDDIGRSAIAGQYHYENKRERGKF